jgi:hypothetical protein
MQRAEMPWLGDHVLFDIHQGFQVGMYQEQGDLGHALAIL